jgi:hypothetical protein
MVGPVLGIRAYGVTIAIRLSDAALAGPLRSILPPRHAAADPAGAQVAFGFAGRADGAFTVTRGPAFLADGVPLHAALGCLDAHIRQSIAGESPEFVFVHAGVVAHRGRGLILPGVSFAGKTELVAALLRAGASYYSDEFAVLDADGRVHPYPRRLSVRDRGTGQARDTPAEELGAPTGISPVAVRLIAVTRYVARAEWRPVERSPAGGALHLLAHTGQARREPERTLQAVYRAAEGAIVLEGSRGEAEAAGAALLDLLSRQ